MTRLTSQQKMASRRAVAPIIATLLLVAIAVVGGSIIFVFSQGFFSAAQVSGSPNIESLEFVGYDATDAVSVEIFDGTLFAAGNTAGNGLQIDENIAINVQNNGVSKVTLGEVRFGGTVYAYSAAAFTASTPEYHIMTDNTTFITTSAAEIQPGQQVSIVLDLGEVIKNGRDAQMKLSTSSGSVFVGTVIAGQQSG